MKQFTREEIHDTIQDVFTKEMEHFVDMLRNNMKAYEDDNLLQGDKRTGFALSTMNTAMQMSFIVMRETLCKLLCDEE